MAVDSSIYFQLAQANPGQSMNQGMQLGQRLRGAIDQNQERQKQEAINNIYLSSMQRGQDGKMTLNRDNFLGNMMKGGFGNEAGQFSTQWQKEDDVKKQQQIENQLRREQIYSDMNLKKQAFGLDQDKLNWEKQKSILESTKKNTAAGLNSSDKQRYDNINMAIKGIDGMSSALTNGDNTFTLWGDNDFTANRNRAVEAIGRMQSGGAIGKEEQVRFEKMLPTAFDDAEMQQSKLQAIKDEMNSRFETMGLGAQAQPAKKIRMTDGKGGFFDVPENEYGEAIASGLNRAK